MKLKSRVALLTSVFALTFTVGACSRSAPAEADITADIVRFMSTARIEPNPALTTSELRVAFASSEFSVRDFNYMWYRNGKVVKGEHRNYLDPFHFLKDDQLKVVISSTNPQAAVSRFETETVKIVNSPPQIIKACCVYKPDGKQRLEVQTDAVDYDEDKIRLVYLWFNNGQPLMDETGKSIDPSKFKRGDVIHAEVTATDHLGNSAPTARRRGPSATRRPASSPRQSGSRPRTTVSSTGCRSRTVTATR